jgi:hypothetical protein
MPGRGGEPPRGTLHDHFPLGQLDRVHDGPNGVTVAFLRRPPPVLGSDRGARSSVGKRGTATAGFLEHRGVVAFDPLELLRQRLRGASSHLVDLRPQDLFEIADHLLDQLRGLLQRC